jgi:hypothetical protein
MWIFLLPFALLCKLLSVSLIYGYGLGLIVADFGLLLILRKLLASQYFVIRFIDWYLVKSGGHWNKGILSRRQRGRTNRQ